MDRLDKKIKYPMDFEKWKKLKTTKQAMKILLKDWNERNQLKMDLK
jgi:hypothetical protein